MKQKPSKEGICWRFPPTPIAYGDEFRFGQGTSEHPTVKETDYCGEFDRRS